jgi:hypothetical protein
MTLTAQPPQVAVRSKNASRRPVSADIARGKARRAFGHDGFSYDVDFDHGNRRLADLAEETRRV